MNQFPLWSETSNQLWFGWVCFTFTAAGFSDLWPPNLNLWLWVDILCGSGDLWPLIMMKLWRRICLIQEMSDFTLVSSASSAPKCLSQWLWFDVLMIYWMFSCVVLKRSDSNENIWFHMWIMNAIDFHIQLLLIVDRFSKNSSRRDVMRRFARRRYIPHLPGPPSVRAGATPEDHGG